MCVNVNIMSTKNMKCYIHTMKSECQDMGVRRWERRGPEKVCVISARTSPESGPLTVTLTVTQSGFCNIIAHNSFTIIWKSLCYRMLNAV